MAAPGSAMSGARPDLELPHGPGTPPDRTKGPLSADAIKRMRALSFPGFATEQRGVDQSIVMESVTYDHPKITATVQIRPCSDQCRPMKLDVWKDPKLDTTLKEFLGQPLREASDTVWEVGDTELDGEPMIYTYQLGQAGGGAHGGSTYSDTYVLYWNDGHNEIRVVAAYTGDLQDTKEQMAQVVPKEDLEHVAKAFLDVYSHAWLP